MGTDQLFDLFADPPDDARPRVWWHWMDGNIDPAGIRRDLRWLHSVGVRGVQLFDGGMGGPLVVPRAVRPGSPEWDDAVRTAVMTATELGVELAVATSAGWSATGGPWVRHDDAMKKVVWSQSSVEGGSSIDVPLPPLPDVAGRYQDSPRGDTVDDSTRYAIDWRVLAFREDVSQAILRPARVDASAAVPDWSPLVDGSFSRTVDLPRDPDAWSTAWIEQSFAEPVTVESVVVGLPGPVGFGAAPPAAAVLQVSEDGRSYRDVTDLAVSTAPARTASFPPVTGRLFRLTMSADSAADALPPRSDGVQLPPVLRKASAFRISEFALRTAGRVHNAEAKAGFSVVDDYFTVATDPAVTTGRIDPDHVFDLTGRIDDGVLKWDAPPGRWTILRLGASLTGQTNGPAPADATGLEVDKLDGRRVADYLEVYLRRFGDNAGDGIRALLSDSIEAGAQNFTDDILDEFERLRGYDASRWLPALAGYVVGDAETSDRFLYDYRRTIADLLADQYYGTLSTEAHARDMQYYAEALEDGRPQLGDDLAMRSHADVPMGAMWTFDPTAGPMPTYVADLKGAASVAHVYGKRWTGSEAFTSFQRPWSWTPQSLKPIADLQLSLGVTRFCIHSSPHQPLAAPPPGIALAPFLGQAFTVNETWAGMAGPWIDYLARCSAVLSVGEPAVDIAVFVGEEAPVTGLFAESFDTSVPPEFDFDYVGGDALAAVLRVDADGSLRSQGASYRVLYLGGSSSRMTLHALRDLERLLDAGATVVGARPTGSPSLADDPREVDEVTDRIWAQRASGRVIATSDLGAALSDLGMRPALHIDGPPVRHLARIIDGSRVTFLANPSGESAEVRLAFEARMLPLAAWDPVTLRETAVDADAVGDRATATVSLAPFGSVFLVAGRAVPSTPQQRASVDIPGPWRLDLPGRERTDLHDGPRLWTDLDDAARGHSGTGVYRATVVVTDEQASQPRIELDLGALHDIARVRVNGMDCGIAWTDPFVVDVTTAVQPGLNELDVEIGTPWRNRLIAESREPSGHILAPMVSVYEPTAEPLPAGLAGPVRLRTGG